MIKFLALVALATLASAATLSRDLPRDFPGSPSGRIIGGEDTTIEEVPYQISLHYNGDHNCGGSIISEYWIVTAAHCINTGAKSLRAGSANKNQGGSLHTVAQIISHEGYKITPHGTPNNDIALIRVNEPFILDTKRQPIELFNSGEETPAGAISVTTGWGRTSSGSSPSILQIVKIPIVSKETCNDAYKTYGGLPEGQICAAYPEGGKSGCYGDSGGPLTVNGRLAGITSWGYNCGERGYPGVYTEIAAHRDWIKIHSGV